MYSESIPRRLQLFEQQREATVLGTQYSSVRYRPTIKVWGQQGASVACFPSPTVQNQSHSGSSGMDPKNGNVMQKVLASCLFSGKLHFHEASCSAVHFHILVRQSSIVHIPPSHACKRREYLFTESNLRISSNEPAWTTRRAYEDVVGAIWWFAPPKHAGLGILP